MYCLGLQIRVVLVHRLLLDRVLVHRLVSDRAHDLFDLSWPSRRGVLLVSATDSCLLSGSVLDPQSRYALPEMRVR